MSEFYESRIEGENPHENAFEDFESDLFRVHFGWFVLPVVLLMVYFWPKIQQKLDKSYDEKRDKEYEAKCKKDSDWYISRQRAMEAARQRMQEELNHKAIEHEQKMKEKEEEKNREKLSKLNGFQSYKLSSSTNKSDNHKPDYFPLSDSGPSYSYRPQRRSCCPSRGGCG